MPFTLDKNGKPITSADYFKEEKKEKPKKIKVEVKKKKKK